MIKNHLFSCLRLVKKFLFHNDFAEYITRSSIGLNEEVVDETETLAQQLIISDEHFHNLQHQFIQRIQESVNVVNFVICALNFFALEHKRDVALQKSDIYQQVMENKMSLCDLQDIVSRSRNRLRLLTQFRPCVPIRLFHLDLGKIKVFTSKLKVNYYLK